MNKMLFIFILFSTLLCACHHETSAVVLPTSIPSGTSNPISTPTIQRSLTPTITKTPTVVTTTPTPETPTKSPTNENRAINPEITQICPDLRELPWEDLGLTQEYKLIVEPIDPQIDGFWVISGGDSISQVIPHTDDSDWQYRFEGISPNGEWLIYYRGPENSFETTLWISSIDGSQRWELMPIDSRNFAGWASDEEVIIGGKSDQREYYTPILRINPFILEADPLPPLSETGIGLLNIIIDGNIHYRIYYDKYYGNQVGNEQFVLYNYDTNEMQLVLNWLKDSGLDFRDPFNLYYRMRLFETPNDLISAIIDQPYGIDIMDEMNLITITASLSYQEVMTQVILPGEGPDTQITWISTIHRLIALDRLDYYQAEPRPSQFYTFDYHTMILTDYCLDRGKFAPFSSSSPDERYLAWTVDDETTGHPKETVILDLKTGYLARINGVEVLGWGMADSK